jgi:hypothetical protein
MPLALSATLLDENPAAGRDLRNDVDRSSSVCAGGDITPQHANQS